jgi:hypothetical protein
MLYKFLFLFVHALCTARRVPLYCPNNIYEKQRTNYEDPRYVVFAIFLVPLGPITRFVNYFRREGKKVFRPYIDHEQCSFLYHHGSPGGFTERNTTTGRYWIQSQIVLVTRRMRFFVIVAVCEVFVSQRASCVESAGRINSVACVCDVIGCLKIPYTKKK